MTEKKYKTKIEQDFINLIENSTQEPDFESLGYIMRVQLEMAELAREILQLRKRS
jgi:hypothetical protein